MSSISYVTFIWKRLLFLSGVGVVTKLFKTAAPTWNAGWGSKDRMRWLIPGREGYGWNGQMVAGQEFSLCLKQSKLDLPAAFAWYGLEPCILDHSPLCI